MTSTMHQYSTIPQADIPIFNPQRPKHTSRLIKIYQYLPCSKVLGFTALCGLAWYIYGSAYLYRDPGGIFFNKAKAYNRKYSLERENEALKFLQKHVYSKEARTPSQEGQEVMKAGEQPSVCGVVTSYGGFRGKDSQFLELSLATLLSSLTPSERNDLDLRVFITNSNLKDHPLHASPVLSLADRVSSPKDVASPALLEKLSLLEAKPTAKDVVLNKSAIDLSLAILHCYLNSTAPYIAFFEDDIIAAEGWFARTKTAISEANTLAAQYKQQWLDLRLFNPIVELSWSSGLNLLGKVFRIIAVIAVLVIILEVLRKVNKSLCRGTWTSTSKSFSDKSLGTLCFFTIPISTVLFFYSGQSIIPRPAGVSIQSWGCCTQGTIFPREEVPALVKAIQKPGNEEEAHAFDVWVKLYAAKENKLRMVLDPSMIQHTGFKSVVNSNISRIFPWSPQFEDLDSKNLKENHYRLVGELYGV